jgi:hypothetical protein
MRNYIISFVLILKVLCLNSQVELKGVIIGEKNQIGWIETSIYGVKGVIASDTILDGRCYIINFFPSNDGKLVSRLYNSDVTSLIKGLENRYGISYTMSDASGDPDVFRYSAIKDGIEFFIYAESSQLVEPPIELSFFIRNI